jgi:hypothetical protein
VHALRFAIRSFRWERVTVKGPHQTPSQNSVYCRSENVAGASYGLTPMYLKEKDQQMNGWVSAGQVSVLKSVDFDGQVAYMS